MFNIYLFGSNFNSIYPQSKGYDKKTLNEALKFLYKATASLGGTEVLGPLKDIYQQRTKGRLSQRYSFHNRWRNKQRRTNYEPCQGSWLIVQLYIL